MTNYGTMMNLGKLDGKNLAWSWKKWLPYSKMLSAVDSCGIECMAAWSIFQRTNTQRIFPIHLYQLRSRDSVLVLIGPIFEYQTYWNSDVPTGFPMPPLRDTSMSRSRESADMLPIAAAGWSNAPVNEMSQFGSTSQFGNCYIMIY